MSEQTMALNEEETKSPSVDEDLLSGICDADLTRVQEHLSQLCELAEEGELSIEKLTEPTTLRRIVELLDKNDVSNEIHFRAVFLLGGMVLGTKEQLLSVVQSDACRVLIKRLSSPHHPVVDQSLWALAKIASAGSDLRDMLVRRGVVQLLRGLVLNIKRSLPEQTLVLISYCFSRILIHTDVPLRDEMVALSLPAIRQLLLYQFDMRSRTTHTCMSIVYIAESQSPLIWDLLDPEVLAYLTHILHFSKLPNQLQPVLAIFEHVSLHNPHQIVSCGVLSSFHRLLSLDPQDTYVSVIFRILVATVGTSEIRIQAVLEAQLVQPIVKLFVSERLETRRSAVDLISRMASNANRSQTTVMLLSGVLLPLVTMLLDVLDEQMVLKVQSTLVYVLNAAKHHNEIAYVRKCLLGCAKSGGLKTL